MTDEVPQNEVLSVTYTISRSGLYPLFEKLHANSNVVKIEHTWDQRSADFRVTVYFAIMDLSKQQSTALASVKESFINAEYTASVRS